MLFIGIDDLRPEIGVYGSEAASTPNIDKLAAQGVRFDRAYCQVALCNPSRASVMTGCRPATTGVIDLKTHFRSALPDILTLPQAFKQAGYQSWSLGKIFHGKLLDEASWTEAPYLPERKLIYAIEENRELHKPRKKGPPTERAEVSDDTYRDGLLTKRAIELLQAAGAEPFFMAVGYFKPHLPLAAPARYWDRHPLESIRLASNPAPATGAPPYSGRSSGELRQFHGVPRKGAIPDPMARDLIRAYHACVSYVDAQVGELLLALEESGHAQDTIVVLWSDHGWYLGEHGLWAKMGVHELGLRTPLIVRLPGSDQSGQDRPDSAESGHAQSGRASDALVELVDLYPTLCELSGVPLPEHLEGTSFAPILDGSRESIKLAAFSEHHAKNESAYSIRSARWRLNSWRSTATGEELAIELYDLDSDPAEDTNLAAEASHRNVIAELRLQMRSAWPAVFRD